MTFKSLVLTTVCFTVMAGFSRMATADDPKVFGAKAIPLTGNEDAETAIAKQRYNTAVREKDALRANYENGGSRPLDALFDACRRVLKSELDLVADSSQRITVFKRLVEIEKRCESISEAAYKLGDVPYDQFLRKKYNRLTAELSLAREEKKVAKAHAATP